MFVNLSEAAANLKCRPIEVIKLNSGNAMFGAISEKFRTFDMQIILAIPTIFHFRWWLWEFFFPSSKAQNFCHFVNQLVKKVKNFLGISRQSLD